MPHREHEDQARLPTEFTPAQYPPFPDNNPSFPTIDLATISLSKIQAGDPAEQSRMFDACTNWGFFYLELAGTPAGETLISSADAVCRVAESTFRLPLATKLTHEFAGKSLAGYKRIGRTVTDKNHTPDTAEFFNVAKDDALAAVAGKSVVRAYPAPITEAWPLFAEYCATAHALGMQLVTVLAEQLGIATEELAQRHQIGQSAGDHVRMTRGPARKDPAMPEIQTPAHTDFGTITILMNWLGGLQLYSSPNRTVGNLAFDDSNEAGAAWRWVKPKPGCAIVNLGDAAVKFTNGVLCSGRHRVVPAPGTQGMWPRYSLVYFVRPNDECKLKTLKGKGIPPADDQDEEGVNAQEWIIQQAQKLSG